MNYRALSYEMSSGMTEAALRNHSSEKVVPARECCSLYAGFWILTCSKLAQHANIISVPLQHAVKQTDDILMVLSHGLLTAERWLLYSP